MGNVVSDIKGATATDIIKGLIASEPIEKLLTYIRRGALEKKKEALRAELEAELSPRHLFLLKKIHEHIEYLTNELNTLDDYLFAAMAPYQKQ